MKEIEVAIIGPNGLTYEEVAIPAEKIRLVFPRNTFQATITGDHANISISTDLAGLPAVMQKLEALAAVLAIEVEQPDLIVQHSVEAPAQ